MTRREDAEDGIVGTGHYPRPGDDDYKRRPVVPPAITDVVAPLGPNARAMLEGRLPDCRCGHRESGHSSAGCVRCQCDGWAPPIKQPSPRPTVLNLLRDARELIARRRDPVYGSLQITDAQIDELARAWVQNLMSNYVVAGME